MERLYYWVKVLFAMAVPFYFLLTGYWLFKYPKFYFYEDEFTTEELKVTTYDVSRNRTSATEIYHIDGLVGNEEKYFYFGGNDVFAKTIDRDLFEGKGDLFNGKLEYESIKDLNITLKVAARSNDRQVYYIPNDKTLGEVIGKFKSDGIDFIVALNLIYAIFTFVFIQLKKKVKSHQLSRRPMSL